MPKRDAAPKKGAMKSKAVVAKGARGARKAAAAEDEAGLDEMLDMELEAPARKPAASRRARGARKLAVVPKPAVEDEDSMLDIDADEAPAPRAAGPKPKAASARLVQLLNDSLGWELRAQAMYAHYAAYVKGVESLTLAEHFEAEVTESLGHAKKVRDIIAALGGEAVSTRDAAEIVHTEDTREMLEEALKTESAAAAAYQKIVPLVKDNPLFYHAIYHILKDETAAVIEVETLLGR